MYLRQAIKPDRWSACDRVTALFLILKSPAKKKAQTS